MQITLAQTNSIIGNFEANTTLVTNTIKKYTDTDLFLFPELTISGYMPYDYMEYKAIFDTQDRHLHSIAQSLVNSQIAIVGGIGLCEKSNAQIQNTYANCAFILCADGIQAIYTKYALPTDDVFFETRYFLAPQRTHNTPYIIHGMRMGIFICYDLWHKEYVMNAAKENLDCILWISASPYTKHKHAQRLFLAHRATTLANAPLFMTNAVGANDEIVFDGQSFAMNKDGTLVHTCALCTEDTQSFELNNAGEIRHNVRVERTTETRHSRIHTVPAHSPYTKKTTLSKLSLEKAHEVLSVLELGLTDYVKKNRMPMHVHVGLSGGIDSAVTAAIAVRALGHKSVTAILLPSHYTSEQSIRDAKMLAENLNIETYTLDITPIFQSTLNQFSAIHTQNKCGITKENMQARIRGLLLMAYANECSSMLLTTGNKSEVAVGYCTLYGDMCGALNLIGDVYKTEVYKIADAINTDAGKCIISQSIMSKAPTAELRENQKDSDSLPEYPLLDAMLYEFIENKHNLASVCSDARFADKKDIVKKVWHLLKKAEYKRYQAAPIIKISECAFGRGRIMPITAQI